MSLVKINHHPSRFQLAVFGGIWLIVFGILGVSLLRAGRPASLTTFVLTAAVAVPIVGWIAPKAMRLVYLGMAYATFPIGFVVSFVILVLVYYLVLTPIGMLLWAFRYDSMCRNFDQGARTYWNPRGASPSPQAYFRQF